MYINGASPTLLLNLLYKFFLFKIFSSPKSLLSLNLFLAFFFILLLILFMEAEPDHITSQYSLFPSSPATSPVSDSYFEMDHPSPISIKNLKPFVPGDKVIAHPETMVASSLTLAPLQVALLEPPNGYVGYTEMIDFIKRHPFRWIMTMTPQAAYQDLICEFWLSCKVKKGKNDDAYISGYVLNGSKRVAITLDLIKEVFELGYREQEGYSPCVSNKVAKSIMTQVGYPQAEFQKSSNIRLKFLSGIWNLLIGTISKTLRMKIGGFDTPNSTELQIFHAMVTGNNIDFAKLILNEMIEKVANKTKSNVILFARIFAVLIEKCLDCDYTGVTGATVEIKPIWHTIYHPSTVSTPLLPSMYPADKEAPSQKGKATAKAKAMTKAKGIRIEVMPEAKDQGQAEKAKSKAKAKSQASEAEEDESTESEPEMTLKQLQDSSKTSSSLISSKPQSSEAERLIRKRKPQSTLTPAIQSEQQPPQSKKLKPSSPMSAHGTSLLNLLSSFAEGGETAGYLSPVLSSPPHLEPTLPPLAPKLKGARTSKGRPHSTLPSKKGSGVLKRTSSQGPSHSSSVMPSSPTKKGSDKTSFRSPKRVKHSQVSESTSKSPTQTSVHSESALAVNVPSRSQEEIHATNSAQNQEVQTTTSLDEPIMTGVESSTIATSPNQEVVKVPTNVALELEAPTHAFDSATDTHAYDTLPFGNQGNEASFEGVHDSSMTSSIEKETSLRVDDSSSIPQLGEETPFPKPIGLDPKVQAHTEGEPSQQANDPLVRNQAEGEAPTVVIQDPQAKSPAEGEMVVLKDKDPQGESHLVGESVHQVGHDAMMQTPIIVKPSAIQAESSIVGQERAEVLEGGSSYQQAISAFLKLMHPTASTIGDLPDPNEKLATESTSGTTLGNLSVPPFSRNVCGEAFDDEDDQSDHSNSIGHQLDPKAKSTQAEGEITSSALSHLELPTHDASPLHQTLNRHPNSPQLDQRGVSVGPNQQAYQPPQPAPSINDVVVQLTGIKDLVNSGLLNLHERLDRNTNELTEKYQKMCDNLEAKVNDKLKLTTEAFVKDVKVTEEFFNKATQEVKECVQLTVEETKQTLTAVQEAQTQFGATLSQMGTVFNQATPSLYDNLAHIVKKLDKQNLDHTVSQSAIDTRFTRLERLINDLLKPKDDDKKGEKVVKVSDDDDDDNDDHPSHDKKNSSDRDNQAKDKSKDVGPVKKPPTYTQGRRKQVGSKPSGKRVETKRVKDVGGTSEAEAEPQDEIPTQAEVPMPSMPSITKAPQAEAETEAEIHVVDPVIRVHSPSTDEDADPSTISKILSRDDVDSDFDEEIILEKDLGTETDSDVPKPNLPSLEIILNDARAAGATRADLEELEIIYGQAMSLGISLA